jgi:hypothetical protein
MGERLRAMTLPVALSVEMSTVALAVVGCTA